MKLKKDLLSMKVRIQIWRDGRNDHREYFERNGGFDPNMKLICERF